jgi:anionic cell wall polymer biosynthesis LytR-Cps2A-Psr (LCP) family protein/uncharacterized protein YraI
LSKLLITRSSTPAQFTSVHRTRRIRLAVFQVVALLVALIGVRSGQPPAAIAGAIAAPADDPLAAAQAALSLPAPSAAPAPVITLPEGTINVALLGVDKRPNRNFNNTDVIILASINPDIPSVTLLSVPRDWPAYIPGVGVNKINTAYGSGGADLFKATILHNFGLKLDYYVLVNFEGLVHAVDTLDGIDVIATCRLYHVFPRDPYYMGNPYVVAQDYTDTFTGEVWKRGSRVPTTSIDIPQAGIYTLNGLQALAFVRARYGIPGGDVDRGRREQRVSRALFSKAKQLNAIPKIPELLDQFSKYVKTDMPIDKVLYFMSIADRFDDLMIRSRFLDPGGANGAVLDLGEEQTTGTWQAMIQDMLNVALNQRPNDGIPIEVWNGTNDPGFGSAAADRLNELGFHITAIKAADKLYDRTVVVDHTTTKKGSAVPLLLRTFGIRQQNVIADPQKDGPRYVIIVGPDFKTCYYDDTFVLEARKGGDVPDVEGAEPVTPTIGLTPTPLPTPEPTAAPAVTPTEPLSGTEALTPTETVTITTPSPGLPGPQVHVPLGDQVNVRTGPGVRYAVLGQLNEEQFAALAGKSEDGQWWQIQFQGQLGWVAADFVQVIGDTAAIPVVKAAAQPEAVVPRGDVVNVRSGPGVEYGILMRLRQRQSALIIGKSADGEWWKIQLGRGAGWIATRYVTTVGDTSGVPVSQP